MKALPALLVDVVVILVFAILGRSTHAEVNTLVGVWGTAWPFLTGALVGHLVLQAVGALRGDPADWRRGLLVWVSTLVLGLGLRVLSGDTAAWTFVVVASIVLAVLLVGWRLGYALVRRTRTRPKAPIQL